MNMPRGMFCEESAVASRKNVLYFSRLLSAGDVDANDTLIKKKMRFVFFFVLAICISIRHFICIKTSNPFIKRLGSWEMLYSQNELSPTNDKAIPNFWFGVTKDFFLKLICLFYVFSAFNAKNCELIDLRTHLALHLNPTFLHWLGKALQRPWSVNVYCDHNDLCGQLKALEPETGTFDHIATTDNHF